MTYFAAPGKPQASIRLILAGLLIFFAARVAGAASAVRMSGAVAAISAVAPGHWTLLQSGLENSGSARRVEVSASFAGGNTFVRRLTMPGHCALRATILAHCPLLRPGQSHAVIHSQLFMPGAGPAPNGRQMQWAAIMARNGATAILAGPRAQSVGKAVHTIQTAFGIKRGILYISANDAPATAAGWSGLRAVVLAGGLHTLSARQTAALRDWLISGGKIWLMADRVSPRDAAWLLGDAWAVQQTGHTRVASFVMHGRRRQRQVVHLRTSVPMLRLMFMHMRPLLWVRRQPVLLQRAVGRGQLLVSALGVRGLMHGKDGGLGGAVAGRLLYGAGIIVKKPVHELLAQAGAAVGYRIMARGPVMAALGLFCLALVAAAAALAWRKRLAWFAPAAGGAALLTAGAVAALGAQHRRVIPSTASLAVAARVSRSQRRLIMHGQLLLYSPRTAATTISGRAGLRVWPRSASTAARLAWWPDQRWQWRGVPVSSGALLGGEVQGVRRLIKIPRLVARFSARGLVCQFSTGQFTQVRNAFVQAPMGAFALPRAAHGAMLCTARNTLPAGEYVRSAIFSQRQAAEQKADALLAPPRPRPMFCFWTSPSATARPDRAPGSSPRSLLHISPAGRRTQQMLVATPLTFQRVAPGAMVRIPSAFVPIQLTTVGGRFARCTAYDVSTGRWLPDINRGTTIWLKLRVPPSVASLRLSRVRVHVKINAPQRRVTAVAFRDGHIVPFGSRMSPMGALTFTWRAGHGAKARTGVWRVSPRAGLYVGLRIAHINNPLRSWTLTSFSVGLGGRAQGRKRFPRTHAKSNRSGHAKRG